MSNDKDNIKGQDMGLRYGGRVLKFEILVNTDADHRKIARALYNKARGPRLDAAAVAIAVYEGKDGEEIWNAVQEVARSGVAVPGAPGFPGDEDKDE